MANSEHIRLTIQKRERYVLARVEGETPRPNEDERAYLHKIAEHCQRCGCRSILIEKETPQSFDVWDAFTIAPKLAKIGHPHIKVAVVEKAAPLPTKTKLEIAVGEVKALVVRVFTDTREAEQWLLTGEAPGESSH